MKRSKVLLVSALLTVLGSTGPGGSALAAGVGVERILVPEAPNSVTGIVLGTHNFTHNPDGSLQLEYMVTFIGPAAVEAGDGLNIVSVRIARTDSPATLRRNITAAVVERGTATGYSIEGRDVLLNDYHRGA